MTVTSGLERGERERREGEGGRETETYKQTDRQTDRQTERERQRQKDRDTGNYVEW